GGHDNPPNACRCRSSPGRSSVDPIRHAAARKIPEREIAIHLGIEFPQLASGLGIERHDATERTTDEHPPVDDERRYLERTLSSSTRELRRRLTGVISPRRHERRHVLACDLAERRPPTPKRITPIGAPLTVNRSLSC